MHRDHLERTILELLVESPPRHVMELTVEVDAHPVTVDQACTRLHNEGSLSLFSRGVYNITDRGQQRLNETEDNQQQV